MKKPLKIVVVVILVVSAVFLTGWHYFSNLRYIEGVTGIEIPHLRNEIDIYAYDFGVSAFARIDPNVVNDFVKKHSFKPCIHPPADSIYGGIFATLPIEADPLPTKDNLLMLAGHCEYSSWCYYVSPDTGKLWVTVLHPDMAGDFPPGSTGDQDEQ